MQQELIFLFSCSVLLLLTLNGFKRQSPKYILHRAQAVLPGTCTNSLKRAAAPSASSRPQIKFYINPALLPNQPRLFTDLLLADRGDSVLPDPSPCLELPSGSVHHCAHVCDASWVARIGVKHDPNKTRSVQRSCDSAERFELSDS